MCSIRIYYRYLFPWKLSTSLYGVWHILTSIVLSRVPSLPSPRSWKSQSLGAQADNELASSCLSAPRAGITGMGPYARLFPWFVLYESQREIWGEVWRKLGLNWRPGSSWVAAKSCLQMVNQCFTTSGREGRGASQESWQQEAPQMWVSLSDFSADAWRTDELHLDEHHEIWRLQSQWLPITVTLCLTHRTPAFKKVLVSWVTTDVIQSRNQACRPSLSPTVTQVPAREAIHGPREHSRTYSWPSTCTAALLCSSSKGQKRKQNQSPIADRFLHKQLPCILSLQTGARNKIGCFRLSISFMLPRIW